MTTIIWNGKELLADSQSTITSLLHKTGESKVLSKNFNHIKIFSRDNMFFGNQKVLAFAVSGNASASALFNHYADYNEVCDMAEAKPYATVKAVCDNFKILLVLPTVLVTVEFSNGKFKTETHPKHEYFAMGSGSYQIENIAKYKSVSNRGLMRLATLLDEYTGGPMTTWSPEKGIVTGVKQPNLFGVILSLFSGKEKN